MVFFMKPHREKILMFQDGMIMGRKRNPLWEEKANRVREVHALVKSKKKPVRKITKKDFQDFGLKSLLNYYRGSPKRALMEAGYDPGPIKHPKGFWDIEENRVDAVHTVMKITGKKSIDLRKLDFINNGYSLVVKKRSIEELMQEANLEFLRYQREAGYWKIQENRIRAVRNLVNDLGKDPNDITKRDLNSNGLSTILSFHRGSLRAIMKEAGFDVEKKKPPKYWNNKENRTRATKELVNRLDKDPITIGRDDFVGAGLHSLLLKYRDELVSEYERGEIITFDKGYLLKYPSSVQRALAEAGIIK
jgi:hypothetical protein